MNPDDFPQFPDPRVREVMAAAANLLEVLKNNMLTNYERIKANELNIALFAAQHSKPRREPPCPPCLLVDDADAKAHSKPKEPEIKLDVVSFNGNDDGSMTIVVPAGCELKCAQCGAVHVSRAAQSQRKENDE